SVLRSIRSWLRQRAQGKRSAARRESWQAEQDRRSAGGGLGGRGFRGGLPGVAGPGAADGQRGGVGQQVVRGASGHGDGDNVTGARRGLVRGEVDQAVVPGAAGQPVGGGVLAALALG